MDVRGWDTGHHPGVALTEKREQFARLIGQGVSNSEACRLVGVNRKTGTRWRSQQTPRRTAVTMSLASLTRWKWSTLTRALGSRWRTAERNAADGSIATTATR